MNHPSNNYQLATVLYYQAKYESALRAINQFISVKPRSSMAFNNRALIHLKMGNSSLAKEDIQTSLELNHLNYIAYFNLFSIFSSENDEKSALTAIQGGLSSLYLIKGRLTKDKLMLSKSIELSVNNIDALLLLVLLQIGDKNYSKALILVDAAKNMKENQGILQKLEVLIQELQSKYSQDKQQEVLDYLIDTTPTHLKLSGVMLVSQATAQKQHKSRIDRRLSEFNQLYSEINIRAGGVSYLIAKSSDSPQKMDANPVSSNKAQHAKKEEVMTRN